MSSPRACGTWPSPLSAEALASASLRLSAPAVTEDGTLYWVEGRPAERGRNALCRRRLNGHPEDVLPPTTNVRTLVHEYGGFAYVVEGGDIYYVDHADQRLWWCPPAGEPRPITAADTGWRFADFVVDRRRQRLLAVGEHHQPGRHEPENAVVAIALADGRIEPLVRGADFYACPRLSPDGTRLAWLSWNHPHMPWDAAALYVATLDTDGRPGEGQHVAGDSRGSAFQPGWLPDGRLVFAYEAEDFWNLHVLAAGATAPRLLCRMHAEVGLPLWGLGTATWAALDARTLLAAAVEAGVSRLFLVDAQSGAVRPVPCPVGHVGHVAGAAGRAVMLAGWPDHATSVATLDTVSGGVEIVRSAAAAALNPTFVSTPEAITFPTTDGDHAHGFFYAPRHPQYRPLPDERPPLVVMVHGGPTGATVPVFSLAVHFWTTRGFAVLDVNYRGSTGYGRRYRDRLQGNWGVYDVDDCVAGARFLADNDRVDSQRLAIRGGSAGGYTVLAALTFRDAFKAGASLYGVSDLEALVRDTHKFEARYLDGLVGAYPARRELYVQRSPVHAADKLRVPVIFFQGLEDKVVPPAQAEVMVAALRDKGITSEYHAFAGEQHGFRKAETIRAVYTAELAFYGRVFGFTPEGQG